MYTEAQTPCQKRENADTVIAKQLYYLHRTLLVNINFAEKQFLNGSITEADRNYVVEMNHELIEALADIRDDYERPA
jgi:flagellar biosynthesis regulator FlbT